MERYLTDADQKNLESYAAKCDQLKGFTLACIKGTHTGLLLFGSGGNGKSYSIRETLKERGIEEVKPNQSRPRTDDDDDEDAPLAPLVNDYKSFVVHQGRITPKGLVKEMAMYPKSIHLVEDAETMFDSKDCWGVLRMALHSQDHGLHSERRVTWKTSVEIIDFYFTGTIIVVGNRLMDSNKEEVKAVETRCPVCLFDISEPEMIAKMKELCERGYAAISDAQLSKDDCYDVLDFILAAREKDANLAKTKLNFRVLVSGFRFQALERMEQTIDWRTMLLGQMQKEIRGVKRKRSERVYDEKQIAKDIESMSYPSSKDRLIAWCKAVNRNLGWWDHPIGTPEYHRGYEAARKDFARKNG